MEVHLRHHKGVDNKSKPYVALNAVHSNPPSPHPLSDLPHLDSRDPRRRDLCRRLHIRPAFATNLGVSEDEGDEGTLEAGMAQATSLPQVRPDRDWLGQVED